MSIPRPAAVICGLGSCLPPQILTNDDVARHAALDITDEWIRTRTGIQRRRHAGPDVSTGDLATAAGEAALQSAAGWAPDLVILATTTPDRRCPATAPEVAHRLGLTDVPAFDLAAVCSGFIYATAVASGMLLAGLYARPLVIAAETCSRIIDPADRDTAPLFGDGAGAVCLRRGATDEPGAITAVDLGSDGSGSDLAAITAGGSRHPYATDPPPPHQLYLRMRGTPLYAHAVHRMTQSSRTVLARAGWPASSIEVFIGHQANQRILDAVADRLNIAPLHRHGNIREVADTAAASIPLAMYAAAQPGVLRPGARTLLTAFGAGLTWGSITLTWPDLKPHALPPQPHSPRDAPPRKAPDMSPVYDTLLTLLTDKFGIPAQQITPDTSLADLELDSLAVAEFFLTLQERFTMSLGADQWRAERTLKDIVSTVEALR